jgi:hypothetical protein
MPKTKNMSKLLKLHSWEWFRRNDEEYLALKTKSKKEINYWLNELNAHLHAYSKFFGFSIEWKGGFIGSGYYSDLLINYLPSFPHTVRTFSYRAYCVRHSFTAFAW